MCGAVCVSLTRAPRPWGGLTLGGRPMIAVKNERQDNDTNWQSSFVTMLPEVQRRLRRAFRHLDSASREESIAEGVVHCLLSFARLYDQGRAEAASASTLAWYAA